MASRAIPKKLAFQFAIVMVVLTAVPTVLAAIKLVGINRTALESATMELYYSTAKMSALEVDYFVERKRDSAERLATSIIVTEGILNPEALESLGRHFDDDTSLIAASVYDLSANRI
ncbi:MAG: hypothetical protein GY771_00765, partial [bacterium]|nr:hypothetical protein [bacterium]